MPGVRIGRRAYRTASRDFDPQVDMLEGDYYKDSEGGWWARPPRCHVAVRANVQENPDGSISGRVRIPGVFDGVIRSGTWSWGTP